MRAVTRGGDKTTSALNAEIELTTGREEDEEEVCADM